MLINNYYPNTEEYNEVYENLIYQLAACLSRNEYKYTTRYNNKKHILTVDLESPIKHKILYHIEEDSYIIEASKYLIIVCREISELLYNLKDIEEGRFI